MGVTIVHLPKQILKQTTDIIEDLKYRVLGVITSYLSKYLYKSKKVEEKSNSIFSIGRGIKSGLWTEKVYKQVSNNRVVNGKCEGIEDMSENKGKMTVQEAGRKGGNKTSDTHGKEFYKEIGHRGGTRTAETHGEEFYSEIGRKGGSSRVRELIRKGKEEQ